MNFCSKSTIFWWWYGTKRYSYFVSYIFIYSNRVQS